MGIIIAIVVIVALIFYLNRVGGEPDVEKFTFNQMIRHVKSLQQWMDRYYTISNPSDAMKAEFHRKNEQWNHAMAVWKRKDEEAIAKNELNSLLAKSAGAIEKELIPITDRINQLINEGISEEQAISTTLKEWHESNKSR
jgi:hypothetical protein